MSAYAELPARLFLCRSPAEFWGEYLRFGQRLLSGFQSDMPSLSTQIVRRERFLPGKELAFAHVAPVQQNGQSVPWRNSTILRRVQEGLLTLPQRTLEYDRKLNRWGGARGVYFRSPKGRLLEFLTVPQ